MYLSASTRNLPPQLGQVMMVFLSGTISLVGGGLAASASAHVGCAGWGAACCCGEGVFTLNPLMTQMTAAMAMPVPTAPITPMPATIMLATSKNRAIPETILNRRAPSDGDRMIFQITLATSPITAKTKPMSRPRANVSSMMINAKRVLECAVWLPRSPCLPLFDRGLLP